MNNDTVWVDKELIKLKHAHLKDFQLDYEAYFLNNNKYLSDAQFINQERWNPGRLNINDLKPGDRVIVLTHPIYYWPSGLSLANLTSFKIDGQLTSAIDASNFTIEVELLAGEKADHLRVDYNASPKATVWVGKKRIISGVSLIDFTNPVKFRIVAENGIAHSDWMVKIKFIETKFTVYPNPSTGIVSLYFENITSTDSRLDIYNIAGTLVYSEMIIQKGSFTIFRNFSKLPAGMYFLKLTSGDKQLVQRFVRN